MCEKSATLTKLININLKFCLIYHNVDNYENILCIMLVTRYNYFINSSLL